MRKINKYILLVLVVLFTTGCGGVNSVYYDGRECVTGLSSASTGSALYEISCSSCHGSLSTSNKRNKKTTEISSAISQNKGGMAFLSCLTYSQLQAIADALKTL